jgi:hypothetical protein
MKASSGFLGMPRDFRQHFNFWLCGNGRELDDPLQLLLDQGDLVMRSCYLRPNLAQRLPVLAGRFSQVGELI